MYILCSWNGRQISGIDIRLAIKGRICEKQEQYIKEHYPDYDTITTLKRDSIDKNYEVRLGKAIEKVQNFDKEPQDR